MHRSHQASSPRLKAPRRVRAFLALCLGLVVCVPAWAMSLNEAMSALGDVKAQGLLGEQPNGYLGVVKGNGQAAEIARLINEARRAEYQRLSRDNGIPQADVEALAGQKALDRTPAGQYIQVNGQWVAK